MDPLLPEWLPVPALPVDPPDPPEPSGEAVSADGLFPLLHEGAVATKQKKAAGTIHSCPVTR